MLSSFSAKNIATFFLVLMCIQFIPIETHGISYLKFTIMLIAPLVWAEMTPKVSKAFIWGGLYLFVIVFSIVYNMESFRLSTVGYMLSFFFMFITYYNLIYCEAAFTIKHFIKVLKGLILAFTICLLLQQAAIIVGLRSFPVINLMHYLDRGIGANSLAIEPSHSARIMTVLMLCLLRMYEVEWGNTNVTISKLYKNNKWVLIGFLWSMLTMGSGTAFVGLGILALYFIKKQYIFSIIPFLIVFYFAIPYIKFEPLERVQATMEAAITMDQEVVKKADNSAAARVVPLINTLTALDFKAIDTWLGKGIDTNVSAKYLSEEQTVGGISDYGLISYMVSLLFVGTSCFYRLLSLETLIFVLLLGAGIINIAYVWGILMLFTTSKYFLLNGK